MKANETDAVTFLRKWPSKVEVIQDGSGYLVQLAKKVEKPVSKAAPEEPPPPAAEPEILAKKGAPGAELPERLGRELD